MQQKNVVILAMICPLLEQMAADDLMAEGNIVYTAFNDPLLVGQLLDSLGREKNQNPALADRRIKLITNERLIQTSGASMAEVAWALADHYDLKLETRILSA